GVLSRQQDADEDAWRKFRVQAVEDEPSSSTPARPCVFLDRASLWGVASRFGRSDSCSDASFSELGLEEVVESFVEPFTPTEPILTHEAHEAPYDHLSPSEEDPVSIQEVGELDSSNLLIEEQDESKEGPVSRLDPPATCDIGCVEQPFYTSPAPETEGGLASAVDLLVYHPRQSVFQTLETVDSDLHGHCPVPESDIPLPAFRSRSTAWSFGDFEQLSNVGAAFVLQNRLRDELSAPPCMFGRSHVNILATPAFLHRGACRSLHHLSRAVPLMNFRQLALPAHEPDPPSPKFMALIGRCGGAKTAQLGSSTDRLEATAGPRRISASSARSSSFQETASVESMSLSPPRQPLTAEELQAARMGFFFEKEPRVVEDDLEAPRPVYEDLRPPDTSESPPPRRCFACCKPWTWRPARRSRSPTGTRTGAREEVSGSEHGERESGP
ncbi:BXL6, partial [Symbiodinium sp. CCMP2456]